MSAPAFTPGPWLPPDTSTDWVLRANGQPIAIVDYALTDHGEADANARLIASAPELYEALRAIVREADEGRLVSASGDYIDSRGPFVVMENARAALAKAEEATKRQVDAQQSELRG